MSRELVERLRALRSEMEVRFTGQFADNAVNTLDAAMSAVSARDQVALNGIATMMSEFVDNWPNPKKMSTALALIAKTMRVALSLASPAVAGDGGALTDAARELYRIGSKNQFHDPEMRAALRVMSAALSATPPVVDREAAKVGTDPEDQS